MIFTSPYTDANTGKLVMTAAVPLYHNPAQRSQFAGVVAIDFSIADLQNRILGHRILDDGYAYVMAATDGGAVIHKDLDESQPPVSIAELEGVSPSTEFVEDMRAGCDGTAEYERDQYEDTFAYPGVERADIEQGPWLMSYSPETSVGLAGCSSTVGHGFGYSIGLTVSAAALQKPFDEMNTKLAFLIFIALVVLGCVVLLGVLLMSCIARNIGKATVKPIDSLLSLTMKINQGSEFVTKETIDATMGTDTKNHGPELALLVDTYKKMVTVVQAANFQLGAGEYSRALSSYEEALVLFENMGNQRGIGRCQNNMAVAYMELANEAQEAGDMSSKIRYHGLAHQSILGAIEVGRQEVEAAGQRTNSGGGSDRAKTELQKTLGHFLHVHTTISLAGLTEGGHYKELKPGEDSNPLISKAEESRALADSVTNDPMRMLDSRCMLAALRGAVHTGNDQSLPEYGSSGDYWKDAEQFVAAYAPNLSTDPPQCVLKQRLLVQKANDAEARRASPGQDRSHGQQVADQLRIEALRTGPFCEVRSLLDAATALACRGGHRTYGAEALTKVRNLAGGAGAPKAVHFVLDYSGSMAGSQIRSCIESIDSIFQEHLHADDHVALTTFSNSVRAKVPWMIKRGNESSISSGIRGCNRPGGGTAIWDAIVYATGTSGNAAPPDANGSLWICLLTDGEDNSSRSSVEEAKRRIRELTKENKLNGIITISAGSGVSDATKGILRELANASKSGISISTGADSESIRDAFGQAAAAMRNDLVLPY